MGQYRKTYKDWKRLLLEMAKFLEDRLSIERDGILPYNPAFLKLISAEILKLRSGFIITV